MRIVYLALTISLLFAACGPSPKDAAAYNDQIIILDNHIVQRMKALTETYRNYVEDSMRAAHEAAIYEVKSSIMTVENMEAFNENATYKKEALALFNTYLDVLENEHARMIELYCIPEEKYGATERDEWIALSESAERKIKKASNMFIIAQNEFAKANNLTLQDSIPQTQE